MLLSIPFSIFHYKFSEIEGFLGAIRVNPRLFKGVIQPVNFQHSNFYLGKNAYIFVMPKVNHYRIYPTKSQVTKLNETLELCRWVYNETLALRKNAWETEQKRISYYDSKKMIPIWKKDKLELKNVHSHTLQDVTMRVDLAFQAFFP
ncbi:transposase [Methanosarcina sp. UBA289]|uniref:transposase n=1 Tax=Methanosarcina sp. UBA289 TaxID=1915574 RepID=UPI0025D25B41|nr:transposase [Methanosarcina sp. UBA289]